MLLVCIVGELNDLFLCCLLFELDLVSADRDHALLVGLALARDNLQAHHGISRTADQIHHLIQSPAHDILNWTRFALTDPDDQVGRAELALLVRWARGNQAGDLGVLVVNLQHRADALERETHVDVKILGATR